MTRTEQLAQVVAGWFLHPEGDEAPAHPGARSAAEPRAGRREDRRARRSSAAVRPLPAELALVVAGRGARGHGAALALAALGGVRSGAGASGIALVAYWGCAGVEHAAGLPGWPAARRLAASLRGRDLRARAAGRLVVVALSDTEPAAVDDLRRAEAAAGAAAVPCTLVLAAPRGPTWDPVLATRALVLVHGAEAPVAALAVDGLRDTGALAMALPSPPGLLTRELAAAGLAVPGSLRALSAGLREPA